MEIRQELHKHNNRYFQLISYKIEQAYDFVIATPYLLGNDLDPLAAVAMRTEDGASLLALILSEHVVDDSIGRCSDFPT